MDTQKKSYIQFIRIAACFLVIVNHTNSRIFLSRAPSLTWFASLTYFFICKIAVPLFLMIMGALLLEKQDTPRKSVSRFLRILLATLVASALCYLYMGYSNGGLAGLSVGAFFSKFFKTPILESYWYLYLYLALLCLLPLLQKMAASFDRREMRWLLFLAIGFMGVIPLVPVVFPGYYLQEHLSAPLFSPYVGAVFCGCYMERYLPNDRKTFWVSLGLFLFSVAAQVTATFFLFQRDPANYLQLDDRNSLPILVSAACFYLMIRYIFTRVRFPAWFLKAVVWLGGLTFAIYLLGDLAISLLTPVYSSLCRGIHPMAAMVLWEAVIFLACVPVAAVLKKIPGLRKLL